MQQSIDKINDSGFTSANKKKKKKKKTATLEQLIPLNLNTEKENFFKAETKYNPQFIYSFERIKFPVGYINKNKF